MMSLMGDGGCGRINGRMETSRTTVSSGKVLWDQEFENEDEARRVR